MSETGTLISNNGKITREELAQVPTPATTRCAAKWRALGGRGKTNYLQCVHRG
jgi:hypothetical protein